MRVAHVITRMILGGAQENTLLCCRDLIQHYGDEVLLVTGPPLGPEGSLLDQARQWDVPVALVPSLRRPIRPQHDLSAYFSLGRVLRQFRPDVVHTHSAKAGILGRLAAWRLHVPAVVHTVHGAPYHPYQPAPARMLVRIAERFAARHCHKLISVADAMTDLLAGDGVAPREKFVTIYSGMEVEPFLQAATERRELRADLGYSDEHCVVGKIARLFHLKGHGDLIRAAEHVVGRHRNVRFLLVGDGILRDKLQRDIADRGLSDYFHFAGLVPPERLPAWIGAMDVVVHTSLREGLARVLPQALLAGRPVVSYDIDGAGEVVQDGQTGFLIPPRDVRRLGETISRLVESPTLRREFGRNGRRLCQDRFRHERMTAEIRRVYQQLLTSPREDGSAEPTGAPART